MDQLSGNRGNCGGGGGGGGGDGRYHHQQDQYFLHCGNNRLYVHLTLAFFKGLAEICYWSEIL